MLYKVFALLGALLFHASVSVAFTNPIKARDGSDPFMVRVISFHSAKVCHGSLNHRFTMTDIIVRGYMHVFICTR